MPDGTSAARVGISNVLRDSTVTAPLSSLARLIRDVFSCRHKGQVNCNAEIMSCSYIAEDIQSQDCPYLVFWSTVS